MLKMLKGDFVVEIKEAFKKKGKIYLIFEFFEKNILNLIELYETGLDVDCFLFSRTSSELSFIKLSSVFASSIRKILFIGILNLKISSLDQIIRN